LLCLCSGILLKQDDNIVRIPLNPKCFFGFMPITTFYILFSYKGGHATALALSIYPELLLW
ncbi:MAG: hypothetical protein Q8R24_00485, partial [Legionellaceae bacterium]|nr:hypothetical protein [Legionellaceae bacterium]